MAFHFSSETFNYAAGSSYTKYLDFAIAGSAVLTKPFDAFCDFEDL